jgi:heme exporter protein A
MHTISEVRLSDVRKVFGRQPALSGVTCLLSPGQLSLLMGPNGAGKSTLLGILSTLSRPTSGQILYGARSHGEAEARLRGRIALVGHAPMLYRHMSARENLLFFARMYGVAQVARTVDGWLDRVGMAHAAAKPVQELSRGMTQRIALARALLPDPDLLLLDEPFTGLDRDATELLRRELREAVTAAKIVVVVSHDVEAIDGLAQHLIVLGRGRVVAEKEGEVLSAERVRQHYASAFPR